MPRSTYMKLSNKTIYGMRALFDLAYFSQDEPIQIREIARREDIPMRFLEQILQDLKRAGLVQSKRGPKGGYILDRAPEHISLLSILEALDDVPIYHEPTTEESPAISAPQVSITDEMCHTIFAKVRVLFETTTLADMVRKGEAAGLNNSGYEGFIYVI